MYIVGKVLLMLLDSRYKGTGHCADRLAWRCSIVTNAVSGRKEGGPSAALLGTFGVYSSS